MSTIYLKVSVSVNTIGLLKLSTVKYITNNYASLLNRLDRLLWLKKIIGIMKGWPIRLKRFKNVISAEWSQVHEVKRRRLVIFWSRDLIYSLSGQNLKSVDMLLFSILLNSKSIYHHGLSLGKLGILRMCDFPLDNLPTIVTSY